MRLNGTASALLAGLVWVMGCGGSDEGSPAEAGGQGGSAAGSSGSAAGGQGGKAGAAGAAGAGGSGAGTAGQGGTAGTAGSAGTAGTGGQAGSAGATAGSAGQGGAGAAGASAGASGAGMSGSSGQSGAAGAGEGGAAGASAGAPGEGGAAGTSAGAAGTAGAGGCQADGQQCDGGGICAGGECCAKQQACGSVCCGGAQVCSFGQCVAPGKACQDASDCGAGEYCEKALAESGSSGQGGGGAGGAAGGATCAPSSTGGKCLPLPPVCPDGQEPGPGPLTCLPTCEAKPPVKPFEVELKYAWGGQTTTPFASDVMMTPIVIQLDDDDCDGKVTARDIPEILFTTFAGGAYSTKPGVLHAISIVNGQAVEKWNVPGVLTPSGELAAGNIDGEPGNEVVGCGFDGNMYAFRGDGTLLWKSAEAVPCRIPSIADLDQDGQPEVLGHTRVLNGKDGTTKFSYSGGGYVSASDLDGDGKLDLVSSSRVSRGDGTLLADSTVAGSWNAIGDLDNDGRPEVIAANPGTHSLGIWHLDAGGKAVVVRAAVDINVPFPPTSCGNPPAGGYKGGGPPTVADFNGDGTPDVALAGGLGYAIFDGKKLMDPSVADKDVFLWSSDTQDCSSAATGSSIFDFNGDGKAEVLYSDELHFRIYDGPTGDVLFETCNTTGTLIEYPIVADVDGDDQADIIVASNAYAFSCGGTKQSGIRVFGSKNKDWVRTRRVWNQHPYHVTNIDEDGTVPAVEAPNWTQPGLNNFRQNKQPGSEFAAPDLVVSLGPSCGSPYGIEVTVRNVGQAAVPSGVNVGLYAGQPGQGAPVTYMATSKTLYPAEAETFFVPAGGVEGVEDGLVPVYAIVDDGGAPHTWIECRTDNNQSAAVSGSCKP